MFCYTHHIGMDAPQYVHADVPSAYFSQWKFCYTPHSGMYIPQYEPRVAVP